MPSCGMSSRPGILPRFSSSFVLPTCEVAWEGLLHCHYTFKCVRIHMRLPIVMTMTNKSSATSTYKIFYQCTLCCRQDNYMYPKKLKFCKFIPSKTQIKP